MSKNDGLQYQIMTEYFHFYCVLHQDVDPVASLYVEADEPSLYSRREKLSLQYAIRLAANPSNPAHEVTFPPNYVDLYEQKPKDIK